MRPIYGIGRGEILGDKSADVGGIEVRPRRVVGFPFGKIGGKKT